MELKKMFSGVRLLFSHMRAFFRVLWPAQGIIQIEEAHETAYILSGVAGTQENVRKIGKRLRHEPLSLSGVTIIAHYSQSLIVSLSGTIVMIRGGSQKSDKRLHIVAIHTKPHVIHDLALKKGDWGLFVWGVYSIFFESTLESC